MSDKVIKKFESEMKDLQDRLEVLETKMGNLEKIPEELQKMRDLIAESFGISVDALDLDSNIRDFFFASDRMTSETSQKSIAMNLKNMREFYEKYAEIEHFRDVVMQYMKKWINLILLMSSYKSIKFDDFCSLIMENLDAHIIRRVIDLEDIVKFYGAENATTWKKLIKE